MQFIHSDFVPNVMQPCISSVEKEYSCLFNTIYVEVEESRLTREVKVLRVFLFPDVADPTFPWKPRQVPLPQ